MATLQEILDAREQRAQHQQALLKKYQKALISFTMNIPGPEKRNRDISIGFFVGTRLLVDGLSGHILHKEHKVTNAGWEGYYITDLPADRLKQIAMDIEDTEPIGRLFDIDVITAEGSKLSRENFGHPRRKCLLCENDAAVCARSRTHSLEELQDRTGFLLYLCARQWLTEYIATRAYFALNEEVCTTPKPGLVDRNNQGAHKDMSIRHFFASANALRSYFARFAEEGFLTRDLPPAETFARIRSIGKEAEQAMLRATHNINTHKGAIFSMGLVCAAAGRLPPDAWTPEKLLSECAAMTEGLVSRELSGITQESAKTAGEKIFAKYGISGVRGQAEAGFHAVLSVGLPVLRQGLESGLSFNDAGCAALLHLLATTDDTNLIHRSDRQTQLHVKQEIAELLAANPYPKPEQIIALDTAFIQKNLSPGGSADLLALTYFLHFLTAEA